MPIHIHTHRHTYAPTHAPWQRHAPIHTCTHMHTCTHIHVHIPICTHAHMFIVAPHHSTEAFTKLDPVSSQSSKNISVWMVYLSPLILILWPQINLYSLRRWWMKNVKIFHQALITSSVLSCTPTACPAYTYQIASQTLNLCSSKSIHQTLADTLAPAAPQLSTLTFTHLSICERQSLLWRYFEGRHLCLGSLLLHCCLGSCLWGSNNYHSCAPSSVRSRLGNHTWLFSRIPQPLRGAQVHASPFQRWEEIANVQGLLVVDASVPQRRCIWRRPSAENVEGLSEQAAMEMQVGWGGKGTYPVSPRFQQESLPHLFLNLSPCCGEAMNPTMVSRWLCTASGEYWSYQQENLELQVPWLSQPALLSCDHCFQPHNKWLIVSSLLMLQAPPLSSAPSWPTSIWLSTFLHLQTSLLPCLP